MLGVQSAHHNLWGRSQIVSLVFHAQQEHKSLTMFGKSLEIQPLIANKRSSGGVSLDLSCAEAYFRLCAKDVG